MLTIMTMSQERADKMLQYTSFILMLVAIPPGYASQDLDLSLPGSNVGGQLFAENEGAGRATWFGMGYESRREKAERTRFEDNAMRESVFSGSGGSLSAPASAGGTPSGAGSLSEGGPAGRGGGGSRR